ncbi:MAG TPA: hypothetical protein P5102_02840 [Candidatus Competibacteraceae bacterium]|nr:hypothetical protein [Candidatus Competibacteraceae bacterium]HRZ05082.1 hypothetical protein [Candidatus Competibacteraceae bacterium]HSA47408.1 hypothetical protein [Candidatus Competibacteraceae bacterium]
MTALHLERARQQVNAARRRADLERWRETYRRIAATPARNDEEQLAKHQCLELMEQARPG